MGLMCSLCLMPLAASILKNNQIRDYSIQGIITIGTGQAGMAFAAQTSNSYLSVMLQREDGRLFMSRNKTVSGRTTQQKKIDITDLVGSVGPEVEYRLRIEVVNRANLSVYVDDKLIEEVRIGISAGDVAFLVPKENKAWLDDFRLRVDSATLVCTDFENGSNPFDAGVITASSDRQLMLEGTTDVQLAWLTDGLPARLIPVTGTRTTILEAEEYDLGQGLGYEGRVRNYVNPTGDEFPILGWFSLKGDNVTNANYRIMRQCGFNLSFSHTYTDDALQNCITASRGTGIRLLALSGDIVQAVQKFRDEDQVAGWFLTDEPATNMFSTWRYHLGRIRAADYPGSEKFIYLNMLPVYASAAQLGTESYEEYVERFANELNPGMLSYDNYSILNDANGTAYLLDSFFSNLETVARVSRQTCQPFWAFALSIQFGPYAMPTRQYLEYQIFSALAYGAQGVQYFTYQLPPSAEFTGGTAPVDMQGKKTAVWEHVRAVNQKVLALSPVFLGAQVMDCTHMGKSIPKGTHMLEHLPEPFQQLECTAGLLVSHLVNGKDHYLLLQNCELHASQTIVVQHASGVKRVMDDGTLQNDAEQSQVELEACGHLIYHWTE